MRLEAQDSDQAVARAERDLIELRERSGLLDHEVKRLQKVAEEQNYRLSSLNNRHSDLEGQYEAVRLRASEAETRLMAEQVARQRLETQAEADRSSHQAELSSRDMKLEGLNSRLGATDKILAHTRDQLRDKNEALRGVERTLKETAIEKNTLDRRLEASQQEVDRQVALVNELQRSRVELQERVEMLNKAIAAKDFQLETADNKVASLAERIDGLTKRFDQERHLLESANRRLTEELQNEKAERSLIQGALEIARESRVKIQKKYVSLRKKTRLDTPKTRQRSRGGCGRRRNRTCIRSSHPTRIEPAPADPASHSVERMGGSEPRTSRGNSSEQAQSPFASGVRRRAAFFALARRSHRLRLAPPRVQDGSV